MDPREVPIYLLLPEGHPRLGDTDLLDLVASRFPADVWRARITSQGALEVALEHARWLISQCEVPMSIPVSASTTRIFSFGHGVLSFTLNDLLRAGSWTMAASRRRSWRPTRKTRPPHHPTGRPTRR